MTHKNIKRLLLRAIKVWHDLVAKSPTATKAYVSMLSWACRAFIPRLLGQYIEFTICAQGVRWPPIRFRPLSVILGDSTSILLHPHLGEFDAQALFSKRMAYEAVVFRWLEQNAQVYDCVIEIGANVGVYSVFFDKVIDQRNRQDKRIISFEPSRTAFERLLRNLAANASTAVIPNLLAVSTNFELVEFFEPSEHLTNGSLLKSFSEIFSAEIAFTKVLSVDAKALRTLVGNGRTLIKIDVEGLEPTLLARLAPSLQDWDADIILEVLGVTCAEIESVIQPLRCRRFLIGRSGLEEHQQLFASESERDWLLTRRLKGDFRTPGNFN